MNLKIFTDNVEEKALGQIEKLISLAPFKDSKIRIMPDVHAGSGCVIGFTGALGEKVIPNIVGVDIGCGMLTIELGKLDLDLIKLDKIIRTHVPSGFAIHDSEQQFVSLDKLKCYNSLGNTSRIFKSVGTLGGGNHFIEVDEDEQGNKYLIIHTGSRNLGKQVAEFYQEQAIKNIECKGKISNEHKAAIIKELTLSGEQHLIAEELKKASQDCQLSIPKELCYLDGQGREDYLHDMKICQDYAHVNRTTIALNILRNYFKDDGDAFVDYPDNKILFNLFGTSIGHKGHAILSAFETVHNYISFEDNIVRKGAISAKQGERLLIPMNMRDGCILGIGKGNEDWNCSAPHGAGRLMSRTVAKNIISLEEYATSMTGIYTTSVNESTIDESPSAYKPMQEIIDRIGDTVEITGILKPIYNFKASD